jgi:hypothetical protein
MELIAEPTPTIEKIKKKKIRSMKCCICDKVKKSVQKVIDPMALRYEHVSVKVSMCPECYFVAVEEE